MATATGCSEPASTAPAMRSSRVRLTVAPMTSNSFIAPVVTVPVLSSTTVSTRRVDSSTSGPFTRMPSWAPRPVPTSSAVGVARPSAHGQAMTSTATAAVMATSAGRPATSQPISGADRDGQDGGTKTAEIRSASRCTAALPVCASVTIRVRCASWVSAPTLVATTTSRPPTLTVPPMTACRARPPRHGLAGDHGPVQRRGAFADDTVGGDLLAGTHHELVADGEPLDRDEHFDAVARTATSLAPSSSRARNAAPALRRDAGLQPAAEQQERGDARRDVEVGHGTGAGHRQHTEARAQVRVARAGEQQGVDRPEVGDGDAERDQGVHGRGAVQQVARGGAVERPAPQPTTGVASASSTHVQYGNCAAGTIETTSTGRASAAETNNRGRSAVLDDSRLRVRAPGWARSPGNRRRGPCRRGGRR